MPQGFHQSEETRAKRSQRMMGNQYSLGVHPSEETRAKMRLAHMGNKNSLSVHPSVETRRKLSLARMGNQNTLGHKASAETKEKMSKARTGVALSLEHRARISEGKMGSKNPMYGKRPSRETRVKLRLALLGNQRSLGYRHTEKAKAQMSQSQMGNQNSLGVHLSEETKAKIGLANLGKVVSAETKAKMSVASRKTQKRLWADPEHRCRQVKAIMAGWHIHPNKPEIYLGALLESLYPGEWKFVGDGELIIDGKNPDFWNGDHNLIELYGDYFHKGENPQDRINLFRQFGYKTLVIWESELKQPEKVLAKIKSFA